MGICYIVGAGVCTKIPEPRKDDLVIAADGGFDTLAKAGIVPDVLIGDFDSIKKIPKGVELIRFEVRKDETDMHLSYLEGVRRGYRDFVLLGGIGGRSDHTFANYSLLLYINKNGHTARLVGEGEDATVISSGEYTLKGRPGAHFSVFAFGGGADGVSIKNASYEASDVSLSPEFPLGVSNAFLDTPATVSVKKGYLLIIYEK